MHRHDSFRHPKLDVLRIAIKEKLRKKKQLKHLCWTDQWCSFLLSILIAFAFYYYERNTNSNMCSRRSVSPTTPFFHSNSIDRPADLFPNCQRVFQARMSRLKMDAKQDELFFVPRFAYGTAAHIMQLLFLYCTVRSKTVINMFENGNNTMDKTE